METRGWQNQLIFMAVFAGALLGGNSEGVFLCRMISSRLDRTFVGVCKNGVTAFWQFTDPASK
jgi:hypothetical protein